MNGIQHDRAASGTLPGMNVRTVTALLALVGGLVWAAAGAVGWGDDPVTGAANTLALLGFVVLALAGAGLGYALVTTAPVWLRAVVTVCAGALVALVVTSIAPDLDFPATVLVVAGVVVALLGGLGLALGRRTATPA